MVGRFSHPRGAEREGAVDEGRDAVGRADAAVEALVAAGLLDVAHAQQARDAVVRAWARRTPPVSVRRRLAEVAGYVGGALVVAAAVVFLAQEWEGFGAAGRVLTLAVMALVLYAAAVVVLLLGRRGAPPGSRPGTVLDPGVRRRLAAALMSGGAVAAAFAVGVLVEARSGPLSDAPWAVGGLALAAAAVAGYRLAPTALVQVVAAAGTATAVGAGVAWLWSPAEDLRLGVPLVLVGVGWLLLAEGGFWRERVTGLTLGCGFVLFGVQVPALGDGFEGVGYLATAVVAALAVVLYTRRRHVPYLVTAVAAVTLAVPEALLDWTDGSLGPVGVLLAVGVTLLVAGLLGLRMRRDAGPGPGPRPGTIG